MSKQTKGKQVIIKELVGRLRIQNKKLLEQVVKLNDQLKKVEKKLKDISIIIKQKK